MINLNKLLYSEIILLYFLFNSFIKVHSYSEVNITIRGNGTQKILNDQSRKCGPHSNIVYIPNEIYINGIFYNTNNYYYVNNLENEINNITIRWNNTIQNCNHIFSDLNNVIYFDFSNFDSSEVTYMGCMFINCISL